MSAPERLTAALAGRYRIERELGQGGMAIVYLAHDIRHERNVALKVLRQEVAHGLGAERFLAEIRTTANLQHPHILPLFDSGQIEGFTFYVMPFVAGESLRVKLEREQQLPVEEAVRIAAQVADALHHAHRSGVIHRDIKPSNILLQEGRALVADFGIALALSQVEGSRLTESGLSLGTPHYMSPEQAAGERELDARSDVYALGCVLYEMLAGEPPHDGPNVQSIIARVLSQDVRPLGELRKSVPPNVKAAVSKALEKLPADRFSTAAEFSAALRDASYAPLARSRSAERAKAWPRSAVAGWTVAALLGGLMVPTIRSALGDSSPSDSATPRPVGWFREPFLEGQVPACRGDAGFSLSADGRVLAYRHPCPGTDSTISLWIRRWDALESFPIRGTERAAAPAVSPDGLQVAFHQDSVIKVLSLAGGPVLELMRGTRPLWSEDGYIYATTDSGTARAPARGGTIEPLTRRGSADGVHVITQILPGERSALMHVQRLQRLLPGLGGGAFDVVVLDLVSGVMRTIARGRWPRFVSPGYLVYLDPDQQLLMAVGFDPIRLEPVGAPTPVLANVLHYSLSGSGDLFYSSTERQRLELLWVAPSGQVNPVDSTWQFDIGAVTTNSWSLSSDGSRIAYRQLTEDGHGIWIRDLVTGREFSLQSMPGVEFLPRWHPSGRDVVFSSADRDVWSQRVDRVEEAKLLLDLDRPITQAVWSPNGEWLLIRTGSSLTNPAPGDRDVLVLRAGVDSAPRPLLTGEAYDHMDPVISPDGRWLAYHSNETRQFEVYVRPFPNVADAQVEISAGRGGRSPIWSRDGRELYYVERGRVVAARFSPSTDGLRVEQRRPLFELPLLTHDEGNTIPWDLAPDGRFLMARRVPPSSPSVFLVQNWTEDLKARMGGANADPTRQR